MGRLVRSFGIYDVDRYLCSEFKLSATSPADMMKYPLGIRISQASYRKVDLLIPIRPVPAENA